MKRLLLFLIILFSSKSFADDFITIDGKFNDWENIPVIHSDPFGDGSKVEIDLQRIKITDDDRFVYIYFETTNEISLQNTADLGLFIDLDSNPNTGEKINDIGADLLWYFKRKEGEYKLEANDNISHPDIGLFPAPTISSSRFEIAISKEKIIDEKSIFPNEEIKFVLKDKFDTAPDQTSITYEFTNTNRKYDDIRFDKPPYADFRIVSYNILFDNPFKYPASKSFKKIFKTFDADIILLQEMYDHTAKDVKKLIDELTDTEFIVEKLEPDLVLISKYQIIDKFELDGSAAFYLDTPDEIVPEFLIVNAHLKCCNYDYVRLKQTNQLMNYIDLLKTGRQIRTNTPIVIAGDMNFVGTGEQLDMLLNGNRKGEPDWDKSSFRDVLAPVPNMPIKFTWLDTESNYSPGRLDFMIYSDSVLKVVNKFVLFTKYMNMEDLNKLGLESEDSQKSSDHYPLVIDFKIK